MKFQHTTLLILGNIDLTDYRSVIGGMKVQ